MSASCKPAFQPQTYTTLQSQMDELFRGMHDARNGAEFDAYQNTHWQEGWHEWHSRHAHRSNVKLES